MSSLDFNRATHFSVVWAVMLSFITIVEWRSLDREPLKPEILSPFIQRHIDIVPGQSATGSAQPADPLAGKPTDDTQYIVALDFNGPLFLACFFIPIIAFHGIGALIGRLASR